VFRVPTDSQSIRETPARTVLDPRALGLHTLGLICGYDDIVVRRPFSWSRRKKRDLPASKRVICQTLPTDHNISGNVGAAKQAAAKQAAVQDAGIRLWVYKRQQRKCMFFNIFYMPVQIPRMCGRPVQLPTIKKKPLSVSCMNTRSRCAH